MGLVTGSILDISKQSPAGTLVLWLSPVEKAGGLLEGIPPLSREPNRAQ